MLKDEIYGYTCTCVLSHALNLRDKSMELEREGERERGLFR